MHLPRVLTIAIAALLCGALAGTASAAPSPAPGGAHAAKRKRCATKKERRSARCRKARSKPKPRVPSTVVTVDLLPGSAASIEVPALPLPGGQVLTGAGVTREVPLTGRLTGGFPGRITLGRDIAVALTGGTIVPAVVDVLGDPGCGGAPTLRIDPASTIGLDPAHPAKALLRTAGDATADATVKLRLAFDSRTALGCDAPLLPTGFAETTLALKLTGRVGTRGLLELPLASAPTQATVAVCLVPGPPAQPCAQAPAGYPVTITVHLAVAISLK